VVTDVKMGRWEWLRHVIRMNQEGRLRDLLKVNEKAQTEIDGGVES
jgi:hypothetical protein